MPLRRVFAAGLAVAAAGAVACANTGEPPGGPPDEAPPAILGVYPESGAVIPDLRRDAVIQFDEVIDEMGGGAGASFGGGAGMGAGASTGLGSRILLSPTVGPVKVSWHRSSIRVKPEEGWKPGRVYHLDVLPGIVDLRRNIMKTGRTIVFSTGPEIPQAQLSGMAVQWVEQRTLVGGLIRAARLPDTAAYLAVTDSSGTFRLGNLPPGRYAVFAVVDQNGNRLRDRREAYDSTVVAVDTSASVLLWTFTHDTIGSRLRQVEALDSVAARLTFSQALDPTLPLDSIGVRVAQLPDSTPVRVRALYTTSGYDSLTRQERAIVDSIRAAADTTRAARDTTGARPDTARAGAPPPPREAGPDTSQAARVRAILAQRPVPQDKLVLRFDTLLTPGARYYIEVRGTRNLSGARADSHTQLVVPKPKPAPARAATDTTRAPRDTSSP